MLQKSQKRFTTQLLLFTCFRLAILVTLAKVHFYFFTAIRITFYTSLLLLGPDAHKTIVENVTALRIYMSDALRNSCPS